jgi:hypothetical protein
MCILESIHSERRVVGSNPAPRTKINYKEWSMNTKTGRIDGAGEGIRSDEVPYIDGIGEVITDEVLGVG